GQVSLRWFSATGNMVDLTPNASLSSYIEREAEIGIDLNGDGVLSAPDVINTIESEGSATLITVNGEYQVEMPAGSVALTDGAGQPLAENSDYTLVHAEPKDGGFVAVKQLANGNIALMYFTAAGVLSSQTAEGSVASFVEQEAAIGIDLNGDGILSEPEPADGVVKQIDTASLQWNSAGYSITIEGVTVPVTDGAGTQVEPSVSFEMVNLVRQQWGPDDIEYLAIGRDLDSGDYQVFIYDQFAAQIEIVGPMPESVLQGYEIMDGVDFTGDGVIGRGEAAQSGVTSELSGHWGNEGAIYGSDNADDIVIPDILPAGTNSEDSWVDVFGGAGDDIIVGGNGENYFIGGEGNDTLMGQEDSDNDQEAIYDARGNGATQAPDIRFEPNGDVVIFDDTGDLYRLNLTNSDFNWVKDLSLADGRDEGRDTLVNVDVVFVLNDHGEFGITYDQEAGEYYYKSPYQTFVEVEEDYWGREGEIEGTVGDDTIDVETVPEFADFGFEDWIDISGGNGNDTLYGHAGDSGFEGGRGDDFIDGRDGFDKAEYSLFDFNDYSAFLGYRDNGDGTLTVTKNGTDVLTVELNADGTGTVTDLRPGSESLGTDTLVGIEEIEIEGTVDYLLIQRDSNGYRVSGTNTPEYNPEWGQIRGTVGDDVLEASEENGFMPGDYVDMWGGGGNDTLIGGSGTTFFEGSAGNDIMDGSLGEWSYASYHAPDLSAYDQFWDSPEGIYAFDYRFEEDGSITVFVNDQDLYNLSLTGINGQPGYIEDLWDEDGDFGRDTLINVDTVNLGNPSGMDSLSINYNDEWGYDVWGFIRNYVYAERDDEFNGEVIGTQNDDVINVADFADEITVSADSSIDIIAGDGNDTITGHGGTNWIEGGAGDDIIDGVGGYNTANYYTDGWDYWDQTGLSYSFTTFATRDNGDGTLTVFVDDVDLYHVSLDANGNGFVNDLLAADGDEGNDTLANINEINISTPVGSLYISSDGAGSYQVYGEIKDEAYAESWNTGDGSGVIYGSTQDDVIAASDFAELDASNDMNTIEFYASEGNDTMVGHAGFNTFYTGYFDGDDIMDGGDGHDTVTYINYDESAYSQFTGDGRWQAGVRENAAGDYTIYVENTDMFSVTFDENYTATVTDLWFGDGDSGIDTLINIESIFFDGPVGFAHFEVDPLSGVSVMQDDYQPDVIDNGDGTASIIGTDRNDTILLQDYAELDLSPASSIYVEGGWGDDIIVGHDGSNILVGGSDNDLMDGAGGDDLALFKFEQWDGGQAAPELSIAVEGTVVTISSLNFGDIYRVDLASEIGLDTVGGTPSDASSALTVGNGVRSAFETADDVDTFAVSVEAGQTYIIRGLEDYSQGEGAQPRVSGITNEFGDFSGEWYTEWDEVGQHVVFTPYQSGTAYIAVESDYGNAGNYSLEVLPSGTDAAGELVDVPSDYRAGVAVEDLAMFEKDFVANTEHFEFTVDNYSGETSVVDIDQTDTGYDILINGVKSDEVALV
ncbi:hypothetical protein, partial [Marinobacter sp. MBR-105]